METKQREKKPLNYSALREFIDFYEKSLGFYQIGLKNQMITEADIDERVPEISRKMYVILNELLQGSEKVVEATGS